MDQTRDDGLALICLQCNADRAARWAQENAEAHRARARENMRRLRELRKCGNAPIAEPKDGRERQRRTRKAQAIESDASRLFAPFAQEQEEPRVA